MNFALYTDEHFFGTVNDESKLISILEQDLLGCKCSLMARFLLLSWFKCLLALVSKCLVDMPMKVLSVSHGHVNQFTTLDTKDDGVGHFNSK